jgi:hypothetical protein
MSARMIRVGAAIVGAGGVAGLGLALESFARRLDVLELDVRAAERAHKDVVTHKQLGLGLGERVFKLEQLLLRGGYAGRTGADGEPEYQIDELVAIARKRAERIAACWAAHQGDHVYEDGSPSCSNCGFYNIVRAQQRNDEDIAEMERTDPRRLA